MADSEVEAKPARSTAAKWWLFSIVMLVSLVADQATKIWARGLEKIGVGTGPNGECLVPDDWLSPDKHTAPHCVGKTYEVIKGFWTWRKSWNKGSAFGFLGDLPGGRYILTTVGIAAVVGMIYVLRKSRNDQRILHWALALVAGGAVGNLIDRIYFGAVTDFVSWDLKFMVWPTFNIADVVLVVGVILMFIDIQIEDRHKKKKKGKRDEKAKSAGLVKDLEA